jgi:hypothetical protein
LATSAVIAALAWRIGFLAAASDSGTEVPG